ncbi:TPR domain-containing glycosyltransferase [Paenibacillus taiwanensis]|uniref:TPR domain-containing glycosyltransferase n=1 Tax=Paenibacillus taiwanensis TaxID=401638 RepID=UPI00040CD611|nr:TPR domain-containing glycosyltransferase [Paenibacillus taiwanensis]
MFLRRPKCASRLGVLILAKDEAPYIGACIASTIGADELLVADTGSTDGTQQIAQDHGAYVLSVEWHSDFARARNEALSHMTSEWVLVIDADERLTTPIHEVKEWINHSHIEAYTVIIHNQLSEQHEWHTLQHRTIRLFRRRPEYQYEGKIHEDVGPAILHHSGPASIGNSTVQIHHLGTIASHIHAKQKLKRNYDILVNSLEKPYELSDPFVLYGLGVNSTQRGELVEASQWFEMARRIVPPLAAYRPTLIRDAAKVLLARNLPHLAEEWTRDGLESFHDYADLHLVHGQSLEQQGLWDEALQAYTSASKATSDQYVSEAGASTYLALTAMGNALQALGRHQEAAQQYDAALRTRSHYKPALLGLSASLSDMEVTEEEIVAHLENEWGEIHFPEASTLAHVYAEAGYVSALSKLCSAHLFAPDAIRGLATAWLHMGRYAEAHELLRHLLHAARVHPEDQHRLVSLHAICAWQAYIQGTIQVPYRDKWDPVTSEAYDWLISLANVYSDVRTASTSSILQPAAVAVADRSEVEPPYTNGDEALYELDPIQGCSLEAEQLLSEWVNLLGSEGLVGPLRQWIQYQAPWDVCCAKALFQAGDPYTAVHYLLEAMNEQRLDAEGAIIVGEMLMNAEQWREAVDLLEGARRLQEQSESSGANTIRRDRMLALAYLKLSENHLMQAVSLEPDSAAWKEQLQALQSSIAAVQRIPWQTERTTLQRRNMRLVTKTSVIGVHDRQK